ncbi:acetylcholinesterase-like [Rhipicephalus microplus]|uniref:acetylcholinesterase-like n=1 Tax=Rhipicephalus microplus TaxID=6941 RepID=UPI003F6CE360
MGDQTMALQWVLDHIARFGGNASDVVLMGSASGAWSVGAHLLKDGMGGPRFWSRERFSKVILMSESPFRRYFDDKSHELPSLLDCSRGGTVEKLHCLRTVPAREIVRATSKMVHYFGPSASAHPSLKDASRLTGRRFLLGTVSNEGTHLLDYLKTTSPPDANVDRVLPTFLKRIHNINNGTDIIDAFRKANAPDENVIVPVLAAYGNYAVTASGASWASELLGDLFYTCPLLRLGRELATRERNLVSGYVFDHRPSFALFNDTTGSARFMDLDFVFGRPLDGSRAANEQERELSRRMIDMWATFAKTGNLPFVNGQPWPRYTDDGKDVQVRIGLARFDEVRDYKKNSCAVLPSFVDRK